MKGFSKFIFTGLIFTMVACVSLPTSFPSSTTIDTDGKLRISILNSDGPNPGFYTQGNQYRSVMSKYSGRIGVYSYSVLFQNNSTKIVRVQPLAVRLGPPVTFDVSKLGDQPEKLPTSAAGVKFCCGWLEQTFGGLAGIFEGLPIFAFEDATLKPGQFIKRRIYFLYLKERKPDEIVFFNKAGDKLEKVATVRLNSTAGNSKVDPKNPGTDNPN